MADATDAFTRFKTHFTDTLRELCTAAGSVNKVCRDLGINRQQFSKYLAGSNLPSAYMIQRLIIYFNVDPGVFFLTETARKRRKLYISESDTTAPNLTAGYYLEHTVLKNKIDADVQVGLWRFEQHEHFMECNAELPHFPGNHKVGFDSFQGKVKIFGKQFSLSAECQETGDAVLLGMSRLTFAPQDLLGLRVTTRNGTERLSCTPSLLRYIGSEIEVANVLGGECGIFAEGALSERSAAALRTLKDHADWTSSN